ncbi:pyridoxal phosphate-dependent aminotransferase [candidate division KSB1 bacterium]|nr:pyridoxal phosphate-dependent aminotransferase [candidate division KSB1 bacterium]
MEQKLAETGIISNPKVHLNLNVRSLQGSSTLVINERSNELINNGKEVFKLGLGQSPFPVPNCVVEGLKANAYHKEYLPVKGLHKLREAFSNYYFRRFGVKRSADNVMIGPGSKELMFLIQLVYYGDLLIPTPSWVSYAPQAQIIGRQVRWLPTQFENNWRLVPEELDILCKDDPYRPRLLILNYPNNPCGHTYSIDELKELAEIARKYQIVLLSDEIYGEIGHYGRHTSIAQFYPEGTIIVTGLSKWCGAGGWRLGAFIFPDSLNWLLDAISVAASETFTSTCAPIQYAAIEALKESEEIETYLHHTRRLFRTLGRHCSLQMIKAGIELVEPQGAFYLFPRFTPFSPELKLRGITTSQQLCETLLEEIGVATIPGSDFGRPKENMTLRIAYVDFDGEKVLQAASGIPLESELDEKFIRTHCNKVTTAVDRICEWITAGNGKKTPKTA